MLTLWRGSGCIRRWRGDLEWPNLACNIYANLHGNTPYLTAPLIELIRVLVSDETCPKDLYDYCMSPISARKLITGFGHDRRKRENPTHQELVRPPFETSTSVLGGFTLGRRSSGDSVCFDPYLLPRRSVVSRFPRVHCQYWCLHTHDDVLIDHTLNLESTERGDCRLSLCVYRQMRTPCRAGTSFRRPAAPGFAASPARRCWMSLSTTVGFEYIIE
jgi:hypothetical protein